MSHRDTLLAAARYIEGAADGESDHYRDKSEGAPSGFELAARLREIAEHTERTETALHEILARATMSVDPACGCEACVEVEHVVGRDLLRAARAAVTRDP